MKTCDQCHAEVQDGARFCPSCGYKFAEATPAAAVPTIVLPPQQAAAPAPLQTDGATKRIDALLRGRYLILKKLGEGGMGAVYLVEDTSLFGKQCIVKEMLPYYTTEQEKQEAEKFFLREVQLLAQLKHPGIPQIFDHFIEADHYYYVMEFVEGQTLAALANSKNGKLSEAEVLNYAKQIADILDCIANRAEPVIHRDIKPENILVDANGQVKLVDFGLAKAQSTQIITGDKSSALGTPGYAPPEQYQGKAEPRSDVYALGATMHHLLSGVDPRQASAPFQYDPLARLNPGVSAATVALVERLLNVNVAARPTARELKQYFHNTAAGAKPVVSPPLSPTNLAGLPFNFRSGASARSVAELAQHAERYWQDGIQHLYQGDFERWLRAQGQTALADAAAHLRQNALVDRNAGLEDFLHQLNPQLPSPTLQASVSQLALGAVERGGKSSATVDVTNTTRGYLYGVVQSLAPWLKVTPTRLSVMAGATQTLLVEINTATLAMGAVKTNGLEIQSNGGSLLIDVDMQVSWPPRARVTPASLNLGALNNEERGTPMTGQIVVRNDGGSPLTGELRANSPWLALAPGQPNIITLDSQQSITIEVIADSNLLRENQVNQGSLVLQTAQETLEVPVKAGLRKAGFTTARRVVLWAGFAVLWLVSAVLKVYPLAMLTQWLLRREYGFGDLLIQAHAQVLPLIPMAGASMMATYNAAWGVVGLAMLMLGTAAGLAARALYKPLNEIELYFDPRLEGALPAWEFERIPALAARAGLFVLGLLAIFLNNNTPGDMLVRILASVGLGLALAFGVAIPAVAGPHHAVRLPYRILAVLGLVGLRLVMAPQNNITLEAALWGVFGLLLAPNLNAPMPLRWRAVQARFRPVLVAIALAVCARGLASWIFFQSDYPFYAWYTIIGQIDFPNVLWIALRLAATLAGAYAGLRLTRLLGQAGQPPESLRVFWVLMVVCLLLVLPVYLILRLPLQAVRPTGDAIVLLLAAGGTGAVTVFALRRKPAAQAWLLNSVQAIGGASGKLKSLPARPGSGTLGSGALAQKATSLPMRISQRLLKLLGPNPLDGLTPVTAATAAAIPVLILPTVGALLWTFTSAAVSLLFILLLVGGAVWLVYFLVKSDRS